MSSGVTSDQPRTEAGRDMLRRHLTGNPNEWLQTPWDVQRAILAIEAESARAGLLVELAVAARRYRDAVGKYQHEQNDGLFLSQEVMDAANGLDELLWDIVNERRAELYMDIERSKVESPNPT